MPPARTRTKKAPALINAERGARRQQALAMFSPNEEPFVLRRTGEWQRNLGMLANDPIAQEVFGAVLRRIDSDWLPGA